jgi:3-oxoacyl-[acyl-carrier protein] reductase
MNNTMESRTVILTGASKGVGRATALALVAEHGCTVIAIGRNPVEMRSLQEEATSANGGVEALVLDITASDAVDRIKDAVAGRRVHGLVNNAGLLITRPFGQWTEDDMSRLFRANVFAPVSIVQGLWPLLQGDPPGHVLNIGSMGGFQSSAKFPGLLAYSASKAALANVTECMAEELKDSGVRVNCLCLGAVDTEMLRAAFPGYTALVSPALIGSHIARFILEGHKLFNGKVLPVSLSTP